MSTGWTGTAEAYATSFGRLCAGAVEPLVVALGPAVPGERLLDVGTGSGSVAATADQAGFSVTGLDADASMVAHARRRLPHLSFAEAALPQLPCPAGVFDAVAANFVLNHTTDPRASLRELGRVARPGGRVALSIWPGEVSPINQLWNDVLALASVTPPPGRSLPPSRDFERTPAGLAGVVTETGWEDVIVGEVAWLFRISPADLWVAVAGGIATIGRTYRAQDDAGRRRMHDAYDRLTHERFPGGEVRLASTALLATGRASS